MKKRIVLKETWMNFSFILVLLLMTTGIVSGMDVDSRTVIVPGKLENENEKRALQELSTHLYKMLGSPLKVVPENQWDGKGKAILLGHTRYLIQNGIDLSKADDEAWLIQSMPDGNLVISGGKTRGILYGVYDFLELAGCRYFAIDAKHIPKVKKIVLPDKLHLNKKPYFSFRALYAGFWQGDLYFWHKQNPKFRSMGPRIHGQAHTFHEYSKDFPKDKDEYFAMTEPGKRPRATGQYGPGQVCLTHPEVRRLFKEKLRSNIENEQKDALKSGQPPAAFYRITQNDNHTFCFCESCKKAVEKYGAQSGLLLEFMNDIAKDFPNINIITIAYHNTGSPPNPGSIHARDNVFVEIAQLAAEQREILSPLTAPVNANAAKHIRDWGRVSNNLIVWDYLRVYAQTQPAPYTAIHALRENMPFYARNNIKGYFAEIEYLNFGIAKYNDTHSFQELELYLIMKLMTDPFLDQDALIRDFMKQYYGPAEKEMNEYFNYLTERQKKCNPPTNRKNFSQCRYLDKEFFSTANRFLASAAQKTAGTDYYKRVQFERTIFDSALLFMWEKLTGQDGGFDFTREEIMNRLPGDAAATITRFAGKSFDAARVNTLCAPEKLGIPPALKHRKLRFLVPLGDPGIEDPESPIGFTLAMLKEEKHDRLPVFGAYDFGNRKSLCQLQFRPEDIPQDEKYHFFRIGKIRPAEKAYIYGHWSWRLQYFLYGRFAPEEFDKEYEVWVSAKFTGPAYVKGSKKANGFYFNQAILVDPATNQ